MSMKINRGKDFEKIVRECLEKVGDVTRIPDQTSGYKTTSQNFCDFIYYTYPNIFYIECKSAYGDRFDFSKITDNQKHGMLKKVNKGAFSGVVLWMVEHSKVIVLDIEVVHKMIRDGIKSININKLMDGVYDDYLITVVDAVQKRALISLDGEVLTKAMGGHIYE